MLRRNDGAAIQALPREKLNSGSSEIRNWICVAGAVEHLPVARVPNLADWLATAKEAGAWVYGGEAGAATPHDRADLTGKVVLVLGSEGGGLRRRVAAGCDLLISVPVRGRVASLNVAAAAAVLLFEAARQRAASP